MGDDIFWIPSIPSGQSKRSNSYMIQKVQKERKSNSPSEETGFSDPKTREVFLLIAFIEGKKGEESS